MDRIKQPGYITKINFIDTIRQQHPHFPLTRSNLNRFSEHIRPPLELDGVDVVIFSGLQASGKTTWASALASTYNFRLYRSDTLRLQQKEAPNQMFSIQSREQIYQMMLNSAIVCTEQKQKVVLDATFPASIYSQFAQCFIQKRTKLPRAKARGF